MGAFVLSAQLFEEGDAVLACLNRTFRPKSAQIFAKKVDFFVFRWYHASNCCDGKPVAADSMLSESLRWVRGGGRSAERITSRSRMGEMQVVHPGCARESVIEVRVQGERIATPVTSVTGLQ